MKNAPGEGAVADLTLLVLAVLGLIGISAAARWVLRRLLQTYRQQREPAARVITPPAFVHSRLLLARQESLAMAQKRIQIALGKALADGRQAANLVLIFDIAASPEQIDSGLALRTAEELMAWIRAQYPGLKEVFLGISDNEEILTARDVLLTGRLALSDVDNRRYFLIEQA